jgi:bifunctional non-homologous end joining protein LigD
MDNIIKTTTLYSTAGGSDKAYQITIAQVPGGYDVRYAYGRRTGTLRPGKEPKNSTPLPLDEATTLFESVVSGQVNSKDHYHEGPSSSVTSPPAADQANTRDVSPQLLTEIEGPRAAQLLISPNIAAQMKYDGKRLRVLVEGKSVTAYNRTNQSCGISSTMIRQVQRFAEVGPIMFDGEGIGDVLYVFDLLEVCGKDIRDLRFDERDAQLQAIVAASKSTAIIAAPTEYSETGKIALLQDVKSKGLEGIVLKQIDSPYRSGRRPDQFKHKLTTSSSFLVLTLNYLKPAPRNSVDLGVFDDAGQLIQCGSVTIRNDSFKNSIRVGSVIEVKYLHCFPESNTIYQPRMLGIRDDIPAEDCLLSQLRFKGEM